MVVRCFWSIYFIFSFAVLHNAIYSHMTDTMQMQAAVSIDRKIGGTNAQMPAVEQTPEETVKPPVNAPCAPTEPHPEPEPRKIRKSGTGCLYQINDNLWEGSFFPRLPNGKRKKFNAYAETKEQCEAKLAEMIERVKAEIAEKSKTKRGRRVRRPLLVSYYGLKEIVR